MTALEIEVKGECEPISVILQPYAIHVPGSILVETSVKKPFRVIVLQRFSLNLQRNVSEFFFWSYNTMLTKNLTVYLREVWVTKNAY